MGVCDYTPDTARVVKSTYEISKGHETLKRMHGCGITPAGSSCGEIHAQGWRNRLESQRGSECIATFPIIPNVSGLFRFHVTALKADGAWPPASAASTAKPLTFPHLGALSLDEYHLSPLTCSMQTPVPGVFFLQP